MTTSKPKATRAKTTDPSAGPSLLVHATRNSRWRAGRQFGRTPVEVPVSDLTEDQVTALRADPVLVINEA